MDITLTPAWLRLVEHAEALRHMHLRELFAQQPDRFAALSRRHDGVLADFSKQQLTGDTLSLLLDLARAADVPGAIARLFAGEAINVSEGRAALHPALRHRGDSPMRAEGRDVMPEVRATRARMADLAESVRSGRWRGHSGERIRHVVNIGIGGSDLGPKMAALAMRRLRHPGIDLSFVSNLDGAHIGSTLEKLDPATTLFIASSKSFGTEETRVNAATARRWLLDWAAGDEAALPRHFLAVTARPDAAREFGLPEENVFPMWDWVGGRFSLWSAIGLPLVVAFGAEAFDRLLAGAEAMDRHFSEAAVEDNLPLLLALIDVWNTDFLGATSRVVLPYNHSLKHLAPFLQQLEMESNGKRVGCNGEPVRCATAPVIWGDAGNNGQHAFFQYLHQGGERVPADFIVFAESDFDLPEHQDRLVANCLAQSEALMIGRSRAEAEAELRTAGADDETVARLAPHKVFPGSQPSTTLLLPRLDPWHFGWLLALYEHKVFAQSAIWGINAFDQWGVELGKQLARRLLPAVRGEAPPATEEHDASTLGLLAHYRRLREGRPRT